MRDALKLLSWAWAASAFAACSSGDIAIGVRGYLQGDHRTGPTEYGGSPIYWGSDVGGSPVIGTGGASVVEAGGSTIPAAGGGLIVAAGGSTIPAAGGSTIPIGSAVRPDAGGPPIGAAGGSPTVGAADGGTANTSILLEGGYYSQGDCSGYMWTARDDRGSEIQPACQSGVAGQEVCFQNEACVSGVAVQIPLVDGEYDWGGAWGVMVGWNLAQSVEGDIATANLDGKQAVTFSLQNPAKIPTRLFINVIDDNGAQLGYCKDLPFEDDTTVTALKDLTLDCWTLGGPAFDPATMRPTSLSIQIPARMTGPIKFDNLCITQLVIQ